MIESMRYVHSKKFDYLDYDDCEEKDFSMEGKGPLGQIRIYDSYFIDRRWLMTMSK